MSPDISETEGKLSRRLWGQFIWFMKTLLGPCLVKLKMTSLYNFFKNFWYNRLMKLPVILMKYYIDDEVLQRNVMWPPRCSTSSRFFQELLVQPSYEASCHTDEVLFDLKSNKGENSKLLISTMCSVVHTMPLSWLLCIITIWNTDTWSDTFSPILARSVIWTVAYLLVFQGHKTVRVNGVQFVNVQSTCISTTKMVDKGTEHVVTFNTKTRSDPVDLLVEYITITKRVPKFLRVDGVKEFVDTLCSHTLKTLLALSDIINGSLFRHPILQPVSGLTPLRILSTNANFCGVRPT